MAFKRFDQTGNEKLNFKEFSDMMTRRTDSKKTTRSSKKPSTEQKEENPDMTGCSSNGDQQESGTVNPD